MPKFTLIQNGQQVHNVTLTNNTSVNVVVSDTTPMEGDDVSVIADTVTGITVTDNGVDVTAEFTVYGDDYIYTIPSIDADHEIIVIGNEEVGQNIYVKQNGAWLKAAKIFVKQNGTWKEGKMFVKGSGTWKS